MPETKALVMLDVSIHLMNMPRVQNVSSVASSLKRNLRSSLEAPAVSQSHLHQAGLGSAAALSFTMVVPFGEASLVMAIVVTCGTRMNQDE